MSNQDAVSEVITAVEKAESSSNTGGEWWGHLILEVTTLGIGAAVMSTAAAPIVIPAAILIATVAIFSTSGSNEAEVKKMHMPDEWLAQVSDSQEASREGLAFLAKLLSKQGFITVGQAEEWVKLEHKIATRRAEEAEKARRKQADRDDKSREKAQQLQSAGAKALLARAQTEIPSLVNLDDISLALKTLGHSTGQVLSKIPGVEKASETLGSLFSGKGKAGNKPAVNLATTPTTVEQP
ncbi:hypothetical protein [Pseudomonas amygdali]|uniref:Uncharacterized protein n=2 Tax=Pseudomonas amygdali TaxID=47877 RepID=A0AAD0V9M9_PSEAV|nr:hypothetical protein [Pseudomonas amygdali]AXH59975.1 hypothetical protein PLA107_032635 [Pseudomonas amygdali pv. lachrymans str. M301315]RMT06228.1 hypothetical protein ALP54_03832 [Pseudomonas amygdali pv. lachrymans]